MQRRWLFLVLVIIFCLLSGCSKAKNIDNKTAKWNAFLGDNNGKTGTVTSAPEVDQNGNELTTNAVVGKPTAESSATPDFIPLPVPMNATAKECLTAWLDGVKNCNWDQVKVMSDGYDNLKNPVADAGAIHYVLNKMSWKITGGTETSNQATYTVELTIPDVSESLKTYITTTQVDPNDKNIKNKIDSDVAGLVGKAQLKTGTVDVPLVKNGSIWKVVVTDGIVNSVTGGLSDMYTELVYNYLQEVAK